MDNLSFNQGDDSLIKTITLPRQALFGFQNDDLACKVQWCADQMAKGILG